MNSRRFQFVLLMGLLLGSCAGVVGSPTSAIKQETIRFVVGRSDNGKPLGGVDVVLVSSRNVPLGRTDFSGAINVKTSLIRGGDVKAVLFCAEYFFCGAVRVTPELFEYSESYIELAPFAVR